MIDEGCEVALAHCRQRFVYGALKTGSRARSGDATSVIDPVRLAGIQNVGIITDQRQPTP